MNAMMVIAHPASGSFSHAMADAAEQVLAEKGCSCLRQDLCAEGFNPVQPLPESGNTRSEGSSVEAHCRDVRALVRQVA